MIAGSSLRAALFAAACATFASPVAAVASTAPPRQPDAIATSLENCLNGPHAAQTTLAMATCYNKAISAYDALMAKIYPMVLAHVDAKSRAAIELSQKHWLAYRDAAIAANGQPWTADRGTMVELEIGTAGVALVHDRIEQLYLYWPGYAEGPDVYPFTDPNTTLTPK